MTAQKEKTIFVRKLNASGFSGGGSRLAETALGGGVVDVSIAI